MTFDTAAGPFNVGITRAHLEEDTAKLIHGKDASGRPVSLVDFNRSGAPLMEIVTEPEVRSAEQARRYAEELQLLLRAIGVSDADMERGQMRVEANVSFRPRGAGRLRDPRRDQEHELVPVRRAGHRLGDRAASGRPRRRREGRPGDARLGREPRDDVPDARSRRSSDDYRYFPEPDLPPLHLDAAWLAELRARLPELPAARRVRYRDVLGLPAYDAGVIVAEPDAARLFEGALAADPGLDTKQVANWVTGEYLRLRNLATDPVEVSANELARLIRDVASGDLSRANAKEVLAVHASTGRAVADIVAERGYRQISEVGALGSVVDEVLAANPAAVADYRAGKTQAVGFLVGQVMKATRGQANATVVQATVRQRLAEQGRS